MARLLIGSSNVYRFYEAGKFKSYNPYTMMNCTRLEVFKAKMDALEVDDKEIVIYVIKNFICDAVREVVDERVTNENCEKVIKTFMSTLKDATERLPESRFALARPMMRPGNAWYSEKYEDIVKFFDEGVNSIGRSNISKLDPLSKMSQKLEYDRVHLTPECGSIFVEMTLGNAEAFFSAEIVDIDMDEDMEKGEAAGKAMVIEKKRG
jgi:hypothetical protein